jgi:hypothetical protein
MEKSNNHIVCGIFVLLDNSFSWKISEVASDWVLVFPEAWL